MKNLFIIFFLLTLFSCGSKDSTQLDTTIVVTNSLATVAGQSGGIILYGVNKDDESEFFAITFDSNSQSIELNNGEWEFLAVAWDGYNSNIGASGYVMEGTVRCSHIESLQLSGGDQALSLTLSQSGCSDSQFGLSDTKSDGYIKPSEFYSCTNEESIEDSNDDLKCYNSIGNSFQVYLATDGVGGGFDEKMASRCIVNDADMTSGVLDSSSYPHELRLPIFFPREYGLKWGVKVYSDSDCQELSSNSFYEHIYAGEVVGDQGIMNSDLFQSSNQFVVLTPVCNSSVGTSTTPFVSHYVDSDGTLQETVNVLCTAEQVSTFVSANLASDYIVMSDIDFSSHSTFSDSVVSGSFTGNFDGNGHTISNVEIVATGSDSGFFSHIDYGVVEDLTFSNITLECSGSVSNVGTIVGNHSGSLFDITAKNISFNNNGCDYSGGLIGIVDGGGGSDVYVDNLTSTNSIISLSPSSGTRVGGIIGEVSGSFAYVSGVKANDINIQVESFISGSSLEGGAVFGRIDSNNGISNILATGIEIGESSNYLTGFGNFGGLAGYVTNSSISGAKVTGSLYLDGETSSSFSGGIGFLTSSSVEGIIFKGDIHSETHKRVGGVAGKVESLSSIAYGQSYGSIFCVNSCGGIAGDIDGGTAYSVYSDVTISSEADTSETIQNIGGLFGSINDSYVNSAQYDGSIFLSAYSTSSNIGGVAGKISTGSSGASINDYDNLSFTGEVITDAQYVGGIAGYVDQSYDDVDFSYVLITGKVEGSSDVYKDFGSAIDGGYFVNGNSCKWIDFDGSALAGFATNDDCTEEADSNNLILTTTHSFDSALTIDSSTAWADGDSTNSELMELSFVDTLKKLGGEGVLGSEDDPFTIENISQWQSIGDSSVLMERSFSLVSDLNFSGVSSFNPIGK